jgi:hypothetical protein
MIINIIIIMFIITSISIISISTSSTNVFIIKIHRSMCKYF